MNNQYRNLTESEIRNLESNNCYCDNWKLVRVKNGFNTDYVRDSVFSDNVTIGIFEKSFDLKGGVKKHSGIYRATIHNCDIADNVLIDNIHGYIANYSIGENTFIQNVDTIVVSEKTAFGNGVAVSVLDETGGREVLIHDRLSSHFAYIFALYRYRDGLTDRLQQIVKNYTAEISSDKGSIGKDTFIRNIGNITNVKIGGDTVLDGVSRLHNGSINSNGSAPVKIGSQVILEDFIVSSGSVIDEGTMLTRCFVGQGCVIGHGYSAVDSLFFSNCQLENGEACAIFAGPYTVTHHKSTLLIGGMFSFMNAGSGSNQSNHMYKLGPVHQGIMERGGKTSSDSYILWPAHIGAFSLVKGRHYSNPDISDLPFSYLLEDVEGSIIVPARNLCTVGTVRDAEKFPKRDIRTDSDKLDRINFSLLNPYIIGKILKGIEILKELEKSHSDNPISYIYQNCRIKASALKQGINLYQLAIDKYIGDSLINQIRREIPNSIESLRNILNPKTIAILSKWADLSGLLAPHQEVEFLLDDIVEGNIIDINSINNAFGKIYQKSDSFEWTWVFMLINDTYQITPDTISPTDIIDIIKRWEKASIYLDEKIYEDAKKEFSHSMQVGFGMDGEEDDRIIDFKKVRGNFEENPFVKSVTERIKHTRKLANELITKLEKL